MPETALCPTCGKAVILDLENLPPCFPFCCERCKLVDLGKWCDGSYAIPVQEPPDGAEQDD